MFEGKSQEEMQTLTQWEEMALAVRTELAASLLEEQVAGAPGNRRPYRDLLFSFRPMHVMLTVLKK